MSLDKQIEKAQKEYRNLFIKMKAVETKIAVLNKKKSAIIVEAPTCSVNARKTAG